MEKSEKAYLVILILLLLGFNILLAVNSYYSYTFQEATKDVIKTPIPLII